MKDRISDLHRQSSVPPEKRSPDGSRDRGKKPLARRSIPWGSMTFGLGAAFFIWGFIPIGNGVLPDFMTYSSVMGRREAGVQNVVTNETMNAMAAAEGLKAQTLAPIDVEKNVEIANQTAIIDIDKNLKISVGQAEIEQVKSCRVDMRRSAGQAYASCVAGGFETGVQCDAARDVILANIADCGSLPGEEVAQASTGETAEGVQ